MNEIPKQRRSRAELDALADGVDDGSPLAGFLAEVRSLQSTPPTEPSRALAEFVSAPDRSPVVDTSPPRRPKMITALTAAAGTTVGKLVLASTAAAALVTGVAVSDTIDLPGIGPDPTTVIATQDDSSSTSSSSSSSTSTSTSSSTSTTSTTSAPSNSIFLPELVPGQIDVSGLDLPDTGATTLAAADAGTITVRVISGSLVLTTIDPAAGWSAFDDSSDSPNEIDVSFRRGDDRVDIDIDIEDGQLRVRVRDRRTDEEFSRTLNGQRFGDDDDLDDDGDLDDDSDYDDDLDDDGDLDDEDVDDDDDLNADDSDESDDDS